MERFREFRLHAASTTGPSAIGNASLGGRKQQHLHLAQRDGDALENIWNQISQAYQAHVAFSLFSLGAYIVGIACVVIIALFLAVATFTIILSKVFLWLLLGIAPLIILTLLFNASSRFFSGWLNSVVQYAVLQILVYAFLAFYLTVTQPVFANLATTMSSGSVDWSALAPFVLIGLTGTFLLTQLPALAASISGGMPMWGLTVGGLWRGHSAASRNGGACERPCSIPRMARPQQIDRRSSGGGAREAHLWRCGRKSAARPTDETINARPVSIPSRQGVQND